MTGNTELLSSAPFSLKCLSQAVRVRPPFFILCSGVLGLLFAGCGSSRPTVFSSSSAGNSYYGNSGNSGTATESCSSYGDCESGTGTGSTATGGGGGCSDSGDPGCGNYDPTSTDGGGNDNGGGTDSGSGADSGGGGDDGGGGDGGGGGDDGSGNDSGACHAGCNDGNTAQTANAGAAAVPLGAWTRSVTLRLHQASTSSGVVLGNPAGLRVAIWRHKAWQLSPITALYATEEL
jgi:hypothetical protein